MELVWLGMGSTPAGLSESEQSPLPNQFCEQREWLEVFRRVVRGLRLGQPEFP